MQKKDSQKKKHGQIARKRELMSFDSAIGETYLEGMRISLQKGSGKSTISSYIVNKINQIHTFHHHKTVKIADFGSCEGDMLNQIRELVDENHRLDLHGFDYNEHLIDIAKKKFPSMRFHQCNLVDGDFSKYENMFDIGFSVNTLHEIFSFSGSEFSHTSSKRYVRKALKNIGRSIKPQGILIVYDGVEHEIDGAKKVRIQIEDKNTAHLLRRFETDYLPIPPKVKNLGNNIYEMNMLVFTRFVTKIRFLDSIIWQIEKEESYQYFAKTEFVSELAAAGFTTNTLVLIRNRLGDWKKRLKILTPGVDYPFEHILLICTKSNGVEKN